MVCVFGCSLLTPHILAVYLDNKLRNWAQIWPVYLDVHCRRPIYGPCIWLFIVADQACVYCGKCFDANSVWHQSCVTCLYDFLKPVTHKTQALEQGSLVFLIKICFLFLIKRLFDFICCWLVLLVGSVNAVLKEIFIWECLCSTVKWTDTCSLLLIVTCMRLFLGLRSWATDLHDSHIQSCHLATTTTTLSRRQWLIMCFVLFVCLCA